MIVVILTVRTALTQSVDAWATISTETLIPLINHMHQTLVPATFVDALLWLPTKTCDSQFVTYMEVGASSYIKCSNIAEADLVFEAVKKQ